MEAFAQLVGWYAALAVLGLVGLPVALFLFDRVPELSYALARALGLLFVGYAAWLLTILGLARFNASLLYCIVLVLALGAWALLPNRRAHLAELWARRREILAFEVLFLAAFLFLVWLRSFDPNPQGTERPMDYALYNAVMVSQTFPPHDPWLSGYAINYYYFGYLLMGVPTLLGGIDPAVGFNLSLATLFAFTAVHTAALVRGLMALHSIEQDVRPPGKIASAVIPLLAVMLVLVVGNQDGALEVLARTEKVVALDAQQTWAAVQNGLWGNPQELDLAYATPETSDFGVIQNIALQDQWSNFNWWWPSRALWDDRMTNGTVERSYNITEFPFFSFYLGDMHPHVMSLPFTILAASLVLGVMARRRIPRLDRNAYDYVSFGLSAVILGSLYFINSWDLPTYALLLGLGLLWVGFRSQSLFSWRRWLLQVAMLLAAAILLYLPFYLTFRSFAGAPSLPPFLQSIPLVRTLANFVGIVYWTKSSLHQLLIIFGLVAVPIGGYLISNHREIALSEHSESSARHSGGLLWMLDRSIGWGWISLIAFAVGLVIGFPLLGLVPVVIYTLRKGLGCSHASTAFIYLAITLLSLILVSADIFFIPDVFGNRMNTVFKFYYQIWTLGGIIAAFSLWIIWQTILARRSAYISWVTLALFAVLLVGALVYPVLALKERAAGKAHGLRGLTAREANNVGEQEAVAWLKSHAAPDDVVLEAAGVSYDSAGTGAGGLAGATGLQTVLGWQGHEEQWRNGDQTALADVARRKQDIQTVYTSRDLQQIRQLLVNYHVRYVVIGATEHKTYPSLDLPLFERFFSKAFTSSDGQVEIFESALP